MAKLLFQDIPSFNGQDQALRQRLIHDDYHHHQHDAVMAATLQPMGLPVVSPDVIMINRIMTHLDRSLSLIVSASNHVEVRQHYLICLLMDVFKLQPDPILVDLIIHALGKHGVTAYHYIPNNEFSAQTNGHEETLVPQILMLRDNAKEGCLVRLGPIVLSLSSSNVLEGLSQIGQGDDDDDDDYGDLLRGAQDLCQLKNTDTSSFV